MGPDNITLEKHISPRINDPLRTSPFAMTIRETLGNLQYGEPGGKRITQDMLNIVDQAIVSPEGATPEGRLNIIKRFEFENDAYDYEAEMIAKTPNLLNSVAGGGGDRAEVTKANDGKNYALTPKQEKFSQLIAAGDKSFSDCYRLAYDTQRMNDKQIHEEASKLSSHPKVTQRVAQINAPVINKTQVKREDIIVSLQRAVDLAEQTAQTGAMVSALRELGKLIDAYPAEKKELTVSDDIVARLQEGRQRAIETMILVSEEEPPTPEEIN